MGWLLEKNDSDLNHFEIFFARTAFGTSPIHGPLLPWGARGDPVVGEGSWFRQEEIGLPTSGRRRQQTTAEIEIARKMLRCPLNDPV